MTLAHKRNITTKLLIDELEMWDEFDIRKNQDPQVDEYYKELMSLISQQIRTSVDWLDSDDARDYFYGEAEYQQEVFRALEDEWDNILNGSYDNVEELLEEVYHRGKQKGYSDIKERIRYTETDKLALTFARDYNYHLIRKIDGDTRHQIKNTIIKGVIAGEHPSKIAPKILDIAEKPLGDSIFSPKQRATMIARTEISRVQNTGILQSYINEGYTEVKILTAEDSNVCYTCLKYAFEFNDEDHITFENRGEERIHNIIRLVEDGEFPPFHPLCRCTYLNIWKSKGQPPKNPYIICLVPMARGIKVPKNLRDSKGIVVNFTREKLEEELEGVVKPDELNQILDLLDKNFRNKVYNTSYEWGAGIGIDGECQKTYSYWEREKIHLSEVLLDAAENKGILTFIHNHPFTTSVLASCGDYNLFAKNKIKYGIVTNEFGMTIIKNKNIDINFDNSLTIKEIAWNIEKGIRADFNEFLLEKEGINPKDLSKNVYKKRFHEYARTKHDKYLEQYQTKLGQYFDITFIKP